MLLVNIEAVEYETNGEIDGSVFEMLSLQNYEQLKFISHSICVSKIK